MKRSMTILAALVMLLGIANVTFATQSRVASLGKAWMYDGDFEDIYFYPNVVASYPRMIVAELGTYPASFAYNGSAAITFANEEQTWGVAGLDINHEVTGEWEFSEYLTWINAQTNTGSLHFHSDIYLPDSKYHLFYARNLGGLSAGLHIARAAGAHTYKNTDTIAGSWESEIEDNSGIWDFNFGLGYSPMENMEASLGFSFKTYSFSGEENYTWPGATPAVTPVSNTLESDGGSGIDVALQVLYGMGENFKLVPTAGITTRSFGFKTTYSDTANHPESGSVSSTEIWAGFGGNYTPAENVRVIGGIDFGYSSSTAEDSFVVAPGYKEAKATTFMFPGFSAAVEADVLKWLTLRIGASKEIAKTTTTTTDLAIGNEEIEESYTSTDYQFNFGLGFKFNKLNIDVKLNDDQPFTAGYLMSGVPGEPFTQVSATYKF